jgi:hypothetical protein
MKSILSFLLALQIYSLAQAQLKDSISYKKVEKDTIYFAVARIKSLKDTTLYRINIFNYSKIPCCVLHSPSIFPGSVPLPTLVRLTEDSSENYNLHYTTRETRFTYEVPLDYESMGYVILPYQKMEFEVFIPNSINKQRLEVQYFKVPNFCYTEFSTEAVSRVGWHRKYIKQTVILEIPHE